MDTAATPATRAHLNTYTPNVVREFAVMYWPHVSGADWDGKSLSLRYGNQWHQCSALMADSLSRWIKKQEAAR